MFSCLKSYSRECDWVWRQQIRLAAVCQIALKQFKCLCSRHFLEPQSSTPCQTPRQLAPRLGCAGLRKLLLRWQPMPLLRHLRSRTLSLGLAGLWYAVTASVLSVLSTDQHRRYLSISFSRQIQHRWTVLLQSLHRQNWLLCRGRRQNSWLLKLEYKPRFHTLDHASSDCLRHVAV